MNSNADAPLNCAFLSCASLDGYVVDDDLAYRPFADADITVERIDWRAPDAHWDKFDIVVVRSTWDYTDDPEDFFAVLEAIDASRADLANPLDVMRWNARKTYLRDVATAGAATVETHWGDGMREGELDRLNRSFCGQPWVIKPVVGANATHAYALGDDTLDACRVEVEHTFRQREWMAQPFMHNVRTEGEYSLFYFHDAYSHAILKTPEPGDFRVQEEHGGLIRAVSADGALRAAGRRAMRALPQGLLYARIDLVRDDDDQFRIMEVELIEPSMYLRMDPASPRRFATATRDWLRGRQG